MYLVIAAFRDVWDLACRFKAWGLRGSWFREYMGLVSKRVDEDFEFYKGLWRLGLTADLGRVSLELRRNEKVISVNRL